MQQAVHMCEQIVMWTYSHDVRMRICSLQKRLQELLGLWLKCYNLYMKCCEFLEAPSHSGRNSYITLPTSDFARYFVKIGAATNSAMCSLVGCIGKLEHPDPKTDKADIIPDWWCHPCGALPVLCLSAALQSAAAGTHRHTHTCLWLWRYAFVTWVRILPFC